MEKSIHAPAYRNLIAWLKSCREKEGISMRELAEQLEVSHSWIAKVEQLERRLDVLEYVRLCKCLRIDPGKGISMLKVK